MRNNLVLNINEMEKLSSLGIDTDNASMTWDSSIHNNFKCQVGNTYYYLSFLPYKKSYHLNGTYNRKMVYPAYTIDDIISLIKEIEIKTDNGHTQYRANINFNTVAIEKKWWDGNRDHTDIIGSVSIASNGLLGSLYGVLMKLYKLKQKTENENRK